ncbi:hypothetical protein AU156_gp067 [Edwardsiella phage PEi20]|uniref:Uncharacterized protein n=1 Tax=Edwardsiella phage PEi20 TaxID=1608310 RepID=A0A0B6VKY1_9CAUD|nr:hypothetical protein AU156_gp067 [Edwardsiella phage PEi20]BAQ22717.1 hypothetical protein [Edwardsiella phage PEi20]
MINLKLPYRFICLDGTLILGPQNTIQYASNKAGVIFESHLRSLVINQSMFLVAINHAAKTNTVPELNLYEFNNFADIVRQHWNETCPNAL